MKHRKLGITWSVMWGTMAVLLLVLWMRSYRRHDMVQFSDVSTGVVTVESIAGRLDVVTMSTGVRIPFHILTEEDFEQPARLWALEVHNGVKIVAFPYWFLTVSIGILAAIPWVKQLPWSRRYSLRTLLMATTLVAVTLGLIIWAAH